jgi:superfamily II DNA or RNA helicase
LLDAITGDIVFKMTVKEGVDQGYLAKPIFRIINLKSDMNCFKDDPNEQTRAHLYYNPKVNEIAGSVVNQMIEELGRPVVILIEEMEQFTSILPYLRHEVKFAHGGCTKENMNKVPELYRKKPNIKELVEDFNNGKYKILVGTSCIGTGTDIRSVGAIVYLQGGRSEIQIKQAIGRGTRLVPGKTDCFFIDFDVYSNSTTHRHSIARRNYYQEVYQQKIEEITL